MTAPIADRPIPPPLRLFIPGKPVSQGSKNLYGGRMVEQNAKGIKALRNAVAEAFAASGHPGFHREAVCAAEFRFSFERPGKHYVGGRKGGTLKASAPLFHGVKPDADKIERAINDALTQCGVWADDCRNADSRTVKEYIRDGMDRGTGVEVHVQQIEWRE